MIRGLYASAAAMLSSGIRHEVASANLANAATVGYKARFPVIGDFQRLLIYNLSAYRKVGAVPIGVGGTGPAVTAITNHVSQGPLRETNRPLDVALEGPGFFVVQTPEGLRYTRAGDWRTDEAGRLVTAEGFPVLGESGFITIGTGTPQISTDGTVMVNGQNVGRLQIVTFPQPEHLLPSIAGTLAATADSGAALPVGAEVIVRQGFLEEANTDIVNAMVELLSSFRAYEASQQAVQAQNETLRLAVNELGRL